MENLVNVIFNYEKNFKGFLISGYTDYEKFKEDLRKHLRENDIEELFEYYTDDNISMNASNSSFEQRKALENIIELLENFKKDLQ